MMGWYRPGRVPDRGEERRVAVSERVTRNLVLRRGWDGWESEPVRVSVDVDDPEELTEHLVTLAEREDGRNRNDPSWLHEYVLQVRNVDMPWVVEFTHQAVPRS
jgi:hypothetical protein